MRDLPSFFCNGVEYFYEVTHDGEIITVYDIDGERVADAEKDTSVESVYWAHFTREDGQVRDGSQDDLYAKSALEIAEWLVAVME